MDLSQYKDLFISESQEHLQTLNQAILDLEQQPTASEPLERVFRAAHTLKGMAATMGYDELAHLAHATEDLLDLVRKQVVRVTPDLVDLLLRAADALAGQLAAIAEDRQPARTEDDLLAALRAFRTAPPTEPPPARGAELLLPTCQVTISIAADSLLKGPRALLVLKRLRELGTVVDCKPPEPALRAADFAASFTVNLATAASPAQIEGLLRRIAEVTEVTVTPVVAARPAPPAAPLPASDLSQSVRVKVAHLDRLLNLVGEMVVNKSWLWRLQQRHGLPDLREALEAHDRILAELQDGVLQARTVPAAQVFNRFPRMIRDLARQEGKEVTLHIEGADMELDRAILQELADPLMHLLRNAVDHGLETPAERVALGKPPAGQIRLSAYRHQDQAIIAVEDDGRGMDPQVLRRVAIERGLITAEQAAELTAEESLMLICRPGFSTAPTVSDVSGRGVGMDAVRRLVESLHGHLEIYSQVGQGTRFVLSLPLTLAIIQALLVRTAHETYAVPLIHVSRTEELLPQDIRTIQDRPVAVLPQELIALQSLAELLDLARPDWSALKHRDEPLPTLIVRHGGQTVGLIVDELLKREEIVVKSLGGFLSHIPGLAGATVLGDGEVVLILDVVNLLSQDAKSQTVRGA